MIMLKVALAQQHHQKIRFVLLENSISLQGKHTLLVKKKLLDVLNLTKFFSHITQIQEMKQRKTIIDHVNQSKEFGISGESLHGCDDDVDHLEVLSLCDADEYDIAEHDYDYILVERKLDKSLDTASSCTKSSSAERDDYSDVIMLQNQSYSDPASSAYSLPQETQLSRTTSTPMTYSTKSISGIIAAKSDISHSGRSIFARNKPFALHLSNDAYHNVMELPSPSTASLHSGHGRFTMQELTTKSSSAPILLKNERKKDDFIGQPIVS